MKKFLAFLLALSITGAAFLTGCGKEKEDKSVMIFSSSEDYRVEDMRKCLEKEFPDYDITIEYMSTGDHAAKLLSEGKQTECDITYDLEYGYIYQMDQNGCLADLTDKCDSSIFLPETIESKSYVPTLRSGGGIIINPEVLAEKNLPEPTCYNDLLKPEYKSLISMPNPKSSGTGYMFLKNLVNAWGEEKAFEYFDKLSENILQFTSSGSGPVNALIQKEVAIGLGMTGQAVTKINTDNANLKVIFFDEGSPYCMYGQGIINGKESSKPVQEVFKYLVETYTYRNCEMFFPEKIFANKDFVIDNYPTNIKYGDMSNNTFDEKERLLAKWTY